MPMTSTQRIVVEAVQQRLRDTIAEQLRLLTSWASAKTSWQLREELEHLTATDYPQRDRVLASYKRQAEEMEAKVADCWKAHNEVIFT